MPVQPAILAGGKGTRMRSVSDTPKVLLPLGDKPILVHQLEWLKAAGFDEVLLCLGYQADEVRAVLGDGSACGLQLQYHVENQPRGTAGAVKDLGDAVEDDLTHSETLDRRTAGCIRDETISAQRVDADLGCGHGHPCQR